jgi:hypothetical protein
MLEKTYIRRPRTVKAIQYDGTYEMILLIEREYINVKIHGGFLYFTGGYHGEDEIYEGDWLIIENGVSTVEVIDKDIFEDMYERRRF